MKETTVGLNIEMKEAAVHYVLEKLDLEDLFEGSKCDRQRKPYIPRVQGWHNGKHLCLLLEVLIVIYVRKRKIKYCCPYSDYNEIINI